MRIFFPNRRTAAGTLKLQMEDGRAGDYETLPDKYFISMSSMQETFEESTGDLRMADIDVAVADVDRKFRDTIFQNAPVKFKVMLEQATARLVKPKALDLDGSTEYLYSASPDFDLNGAEEVLNGGFETTGWTGWGLSQASSRSNAYAHSGTWSLENVGGATPDYDEFVFDSNRMYQVTVEAWVRIQSYTSGAIGLEVLDNANNVLASRNANAGTIGSWQKLVLNIDSILVRKIRLRNTGQRIN